LFDGGVLPNSGSRGFIKGGVMTGCFHKVALGGGYVTGNRTGEDRQSDQGSGQGHKGNGSKVVLSKTKLTGDMVLSGYWHYVQEKVGWGTGPIEGYKKTQNGRGGDGVSPTACKGLGVSAKLRDRPQ